MSKPLKICNFQGCRNVTTDKYCKEHANTKRTPQRKTERSRFLDTRAWRKMSAWKLNRTPWCEHCKRDEDKYVPATAVDHIIPRKDRPDLSLDPDNLQSLCGSCHGKKTGSGQ